MKFFKIEYRQFSWEDIGVIVVSANNAENAIEKARLQDAYEYSVKEYIPYKLGNKSYSPRLGTYNAMWLDEQGNPAYWGNYNPLDGSFYLSTPKGTLASGMWIERWDGEYEFERLGPYSYDEVRRALQLGVFI